MEHKSGYSIGSYNAEALPVVPEFFLFTIQNWSMQVFVCKIRSDLQHHHSFIYLRWEPEISSGVKWE